MTVVVWTFHHGDVLEYSVTCNSSSELACFSLPSLTGEETGSGKNGARYHKAKQELCLFGPETVFVVVL